MNHGYKKDVFCYRYENKCDNKYIDFVIGENCISHQFRFYFGYIDGLIYDWRSFYNFSDETKQRVISIIEHQVDKNIKRRLKIFDLLQYEEIC